MNDPEQNEDRIIPIEDARKGQKKQADNGQKEVAQKDQQHEEAADISRTKAIVEALLFATDSPLSPKKLADLADVEGGVKSVRKIVETLNHEYDGQNRPYQIENIGGGFRLYTRPEFDPWVHELNQTKQQDKLSQAALESLAIISYRQPITRAEIEDIRGVQSGYILRSLIEKSLVKVVGRSDELGRPLLYGTTNDFLETFGLSSLNDLPELDDPDISGGPE
jgi:segregation and condensation protein B